MGGGVIGAFPALSADGILYCLTNKSILYALDVANQGSIKWQKQLDGDTGGAVVLDKKGNVYAGTNATIYAFNSKGEPLWTLEGDNKVTERGAFALNGNMLYATLKGGGLVAVDMTNGTKKWTYPTTKGDAYFPIVDKNGRCLFPDCR